MLTGEELSEYSTQLLAEWSKRSARYLTLPEAVLSRLPTFTVSRPPPAKLPNLPPEILFAIFDHFPSPNDNEHDDVVTRRLHMKHLANLALVSPHFLPYVQHRLYCSLSLEILDDEKISSSFHELSKASDERIETRYLQWTARRLLMLDSTLRNSPHLAQLVTSVTLRINNSGHDFVFEPAAKLFAAVMKILPNLIRLEICGCEKTQLREVLTEMAESSYDTGHRYRLQEIIIRGQAWSSKLRIDVMRNRYALWQFLISDWMKNVERLELDLSCHPSTSNTLQPLDTPHDFPPWLSCDHRLRHLTLALEFTEMLNGLCQILSNSLGGDLYSLDLIVKGPYDATNPAFIPDFTRSLPISVRAVTLSFPDANFPLGLAQSFKETVPAFVQTVKCVVASNQV